MGSLLFTCTISPGLDSPGKSHRDDYLILAKAAPWLPQHCSLRQHFVVLYRGSALAKSTIAGPFQGVALASAQGLSSLEHYLADAMQVVKTCRSRTVAAALALQV